jgi:tetratricopeptide (TPR) repeat protein
VRATRDPEGPPLPEDLDPRRLDREVREQLRALARGVAEQVSLRLLATAELIDTEPELALAHALVARRLASRIAAVREAVGLAAYRAGQWQTAIGELRAYHRMTGRQNHLAVLADCERALGRPERAVDMYRAADRAGLDPQEAVELLIVAAGARADLGQGEAAVEMLQVRELTSEQPWVARLRYAYADSLLAVGRVDEAREWFARAAEVDEDAETDAAERLLELDGVVVDDQDFDDDDSDDDSESVDDHESDEDDEDDESDEDDGFDDDGDDDEPDEDDDEADEDDEDDESDEDDDGFDDEDDDDEPEDDDDEDDEDEDDDEDDEVGDDGDGPEEGPPGDDDGLDDDGQDAHSFSDEGGAADPDKPSL